MRAALQMMEQRIEHAPHPTASDIRKRINAAARHLETAFALWRQHAEEKAAGLKDTWRETRRRSRQHVRQSRRHWKYALRMLQRVPEAA